MQFSLHVTRDPQICPKAMRTATLLPPVWERKISSRVFLSVSMFGRIGVVHVQGPDSAPSVAPGSDPPRSGFPSPTDTFKVIHYKLGIGGKRTVGIWLKSLFVFHNHGPMVLKRGCAKKEVRLGLFLCKICVEKWMKMKLDQESLKPSL